MSALRWTTESACKLAEQLTRPGPPDVPRHGSATSCANKGSAYGVNAKSLDGKPHADRDAQLHHLNT